MIRTLAVFESTKTEIVGMLKREMTDSEKRLAAAIAKQTDRR